MQIDKILVLISPSFRYAKRRALDSSLTSLAKTIKQRDARLRLATFPNTRKQINAKEKTFSRTLSRLPPSALTK